MRVANLLDACDSPARQRGVGSVNPSGPFLRPGAFVSLLWLMATWAVAGEWQAFRGPDGNGVAQETKAPLLWGPGTNVLWKVPLPEPGNSSPIVSRGRVFVTCAEDEGRKRHLYCFDRRTGERTWVRTIEVAAVESTHRTNRHGASTPVADGLRVVVWHGVAGVFCYDFAGTLVWKADLGSVRHEWG